MVNVNIIGRLGADAETISGKNGNFVTFRVATDDWKDGKKITSWFKVNFNGERAAKIVEYLTKGKLVNVIGAETVGTYQAKDGTTQISREINASNIDFISVSSGSAATETNESTTVKTNVGDKKEITTGSFEQKTVTASVTREPEDDLPF